MLIFVQYKMISNILNLSILFTGHTGHYRVVKRSSQCLSPTFHRDINVIDSFQSKQLMLFIWN